MYTLLLLFYKIHSFHCGLKRRGFFNYNLMNGLTCNTKNNNNNKYISYFTYIYSTNYHKNNIINNDYYSRN